jgi:phage/plasmid-like protein (TIGR03299 family)
MSSEIYEHDHMVSALVTPWHRLGTVSDKLLTPTEAYVAAKVDYEIGKHPALTRVREDANFRDVIAELVAANATSPELTFAELLVHIGYDLPIEGKFATVRHDINYPMGVVGDNYTVFQNRQGFDIVEAVGDAVKIETAGSLGNGRKVWALAKMDRTLNLDGDELLAYLLFLWSHDGSSAVRIMPTPVRVVCANTLRMAVSGGRTVWSASHTASIHDRAEQAMQTLRLGNAFYDNFETEVKRLIDLTVEEMTFESILEQIVPDPEPAGGKVSDRKLNNALERRGEIRNLYHNDPRVAPFNGTGWGILQAFSTHDLWYGSVHGGEDKRLERQASRVLTGDTLTNTTTVQGLLAALAA